MTQTSGSGRYNDRAGRDGETRCAAALNTSGWPAAAPMPRGTPGDLSGTGQINVECTVSPWSRMWQKLRQSEAAAEARPGYGVAPYAVVWKKRNKEPGMAGSADPMEGVILMGARNFWQMAARLEAYERAEMDAELEYSRGYRDGARARAIEAAQ